VIVRPVLCRPFVGRFEELAYLRERRLEASASHGSLVLIAGDAGVGKSRLMAEFCASLAYVRCRVASGAALEFGSRPFGPILDVLARFDDAPFSLESATSKQQQFDAIVARFAALAARSALVVTVEDLHWADAATLDLLAYLAAQLSRMRILVVASYRSGDLHAEHQAALGIAKIERAARTGRIELGPLRGVELRAFIEEALAGFTLPESTRREIAFAGDGNPFYTEELLRSAVERSTFDSERRGTLPVSLRETLLERFRPFDADERRIVAQAAVIGRSFNPSLLATTLELGSQRVLETLRKARDFQLIEEIAPTLFRFRHALTREAIYAEFLLAEVRPRHRTIATTLEAAAGDERSIESLAYHWWAAAEPAKAALYNDLAGDAATRVHAHENAIEFYERALEFTTDATASGALLEKIASRRQALTLTADAYDGYRRAAERFEEAGAHDREATCRVLVALCAYTLDLPEPTSGLEVMLARLDPQHYLARSRVHVGLAWLAATLWFPSRAQTHLASVDARALAEAPDIRLRFHNISAWTAMAFGQLERFCDEHAAWLSAAHAMESLAAVAGAHYNGAMCYSLFGLHERALDNVAEALRIARETSSRHARDSTNAVAAMCYLLQGDLGLARDAVESVPLDTENHLNLALASAWGSVVGAYLGDDALIEKWFDSLQPTLGASPDLECAGGHAEILARRGRADDAAMLLHRALPACEVLRENAYTLLAAAKYGGLDDRKRARTLLVDASCGTVEMLESGVLALFDAHVARRDGKPGEVRRHARAAADAFARMRFPLFEAEALELAGETDSALAIYRRCGAAYHVRRLERPAATVEKLSPREREIAILAARGRTNLEIARELAISHKTVEKHLASTYAKLGVMRRLQLGAYVGVT
jgi:DNA-binding CsgD family transcriptional regulator